MVVYKLIMFKRVKNKLFHQNIIHFPPLCGCKTNIISLSSLFQQKGGTFLNVIPALQYNDY